MIFRHWYTPHSHVISIENKEPGLYLSDANYDELWHFRASKPFKRPRASYALGKIGVAVNQSKIWKTGSCGLFWKNEVINTTAGVEISHVQTSQLHPKENGGYETENHEKEYIKPIQ